MLRQRREYADDDKTVVYEETVKVPKPQWDDDEPDPEASTYTLATHGPDPVPDWVITKDAARQYELGVLKSGKEADVYLVERRLGDDVNVLAAKRYRAFEDRQFRNDARYRAGRRTGDRRTDLAVAKGTNMGMAFRAAQWVDTEFATLCRLWSAGASVPYPVQVLGREVMLEFIGNAEGAAPRLIHASSSLDAKAMAALHDQAVELLRVFVACRVVHGDMSPYNLLVWEDRLWAIDFPQAVDPQAPEGFTLLERDIANVIGWFARKGVAAADPDGLTTDLLLASLT